MKVVRLKVGSLLPVQLFVAPVIELPLSLREYTQHHVDLSESIFVHRYRTVTHPQVLSATTQIDHLCVLHLLPALDVYLVYVVPESPRHYTCNIISKIVFICVQQEIVV